MNEGQMETMRTIMGTAKTGSARDNFERIYRTAYEYSFSDRYIISSAPADVENTTVLVKRQSISIAVFINVESGEFFNSVLIGFEHDKRDPNSKLRLVTVVPEARIRQPHDPYYLRGLVKELDAAVLSYSVMMS